jgi:hypothetical protein
MFDESILLFSLSLITCDKAQGIDGQGERMSYQTEHFSTGFIGDPAGHLNDCAKCSELTIGPITLKNNQEMREGGDKLGLR